ncbi:MAG: hypothetical protein ACXWVS_07995 [Hyphomicrobium sp.]
MIRNGGAEALGILRGPIDKVTLTPADDHFAVEMKGTMEGMLALAQTDTGPGSAVVSRCSGVR